MAKFIVLTGIDGIKDHINVDLIAYFHQLDDETLVAFAAGKNDKFMGLRVLETPAQINELINGPVAPSKPAKKATKKRA